MINTVFADGKADVSLIAQLKARSGEVDKKVTLAVCVLGILGEILMILNFLIFTKGVSYHRHIPFALEITLLLIFATISS